jgi:hypothetical protein
VAAWSRNVPAASGSRGSTSQLIIIIIIIIIIITITIIITQDYTADKAIGPGEL